MEGDDPFGMSTEKRSFLKTIAPSTLLFTSIQPTDIDNCLKKIPYFVYNTDNE